MWKQKFLIILFILRYSSSIIAEEGKFFHIDASHGLTNLNVSSIAQDKDGYLWVGTYNGLFRFDGYTFRSYKNEIGGKRSISDNTINHVFCDSKGRLWIATRKGVNLYNPRNDNFHYIMADDNRPNALPNNLVQVIYEDTRGRIWIGHYDGVSVLDNPNVSPEKFVFRNIRFVQKSSVENWISSICEDGSGDIWMGARFRGIYRVNSQSGGFVNYFKPPLTDAGFTISKIIRLSDQTMIFGSFRFGLYTYNRKSDALKEVYSDDRVTSGIYDLIKDSRNRIWIASDKCLALMQDSVSVPKIMTHSFSDPGGISSDAIRCLFEDRSGVIWLGTIGKGVDYYIDPSVKVEVLNQETNPQMPKNLIIQIGFLNGSLFFGSQYSGIFEMNGDKIKKIEFFGSNAHFKFDGVDRLYSGNLFYDFSRKTTGQTKLDPKIREYQFNNSGDIVLPGVKTMQFFDRVENNKTGSISYAVNDSIVLNSKHTQYIHLKNGTFYVLTKHALCELRNDSSLKILLRADKVDGNRYGFNHFKADSNTIWITADHNLIRYSIINGEFQVYNKDRAWGDVIFSFIPDHDHDVWLSTNKGIIFLDVRQNKYSHFDRSDGLPDYLFSEGITLSPDNRVFFGTGDGIVIIDKKTLNLNTYQPPVVLTAFQIHSNEPTANEKTGEEFKTNINEQSSIVLRYDQNYFSISFAALSYRLSAKNQYAFYLEGLEKKWNYVGTERKATYHGLPPGKYTFHVKASNNDGVWNQNAKTLHITITPPFWKTTWFFVFVILIFLLIIFSGFALRIRVIKKQKVELEKQVRQRTAEIMAQKEEIQSQADSLRETNLILQEHQDELKSQAEEISKTNTELIKLNSTKDKFFSIIAHDLKNPFQAINGLVEILLTEYVKMDKENTKEYLTHILSSSKMASGLLENLLEWARSQSNSITFKPEVVNIFFIAEETISLLNVNIKNKGLVLKNTVPGNLMVFADKNMLTTIIRNLLNNAIKFTPSGGLVSISGRDMTEYTEIIISDTGVGMDERIKQKLFRIDQNVSTSGTSGEKGTGLGLIITKEFIDKNNGTIFVESEPGKGSRFIIHLPSHKESIGIPVVAVQNPIENVVAEPEVLVKRYNEPDSTDSESSDQKPLLLVAEDVIDIRTGIKAALEKEYRIIEAGDGEEALKYASDLLPDLIITDWMMPVMEGIVLCEKLKTNFLTSHIPVIMLTAKSTAVNRIQGFDTGADDYMTKPFDNAVLKARVKNLIQSRIVLQKKYSVTAGAEEKQIQINRVDQELMEKLTLLIEKHIDNSDFNVNELCSEMGMSRSQFYRKITALTGQSPVNYLRNYRIKKAAELIKKQNDSISQIMYSVGFSNTSYFARSFREVYGCSPKEYSKK